MPLNFGPVELLFILLVWALPVVLLVWFVRTIMDIRDTLRSIDARLARFEPRRNDIP